jgi:plasmid stability protein
MGAITIRKLDDEVVARLKLRAKAAGRSMEEEARQILTDAAGSRRLSGHEAVEHFRKLRARINGGRPLPVSSLEILREIREEDVLTSPPDAGYP